mgnify:FL=1
MRQRQPHGLLFICLTHNTFHLLIVFCKYLYNQPSARDEEAPQFAFISFPLFPQRFSLYIQLRIIAIMLTRIMFFNIFT